MKFFIFLIMMKSNLQTDLTKPIVISKGNNVVNVRGGKVTLLKDESQN